VAGPTGPQGPPALVSATTATGDASTPGTTIPQAPGVCDGQSGVTLFGAPANIVLGANQVMTVSGSANIGASVAVSNLSLNLCYQPVGGAISALTDFEYFGYPGNFLTLPAGTFMPFSMTRTFSGLPAGTYDVGLCGCIDGTDAWVTDWTWVNVQVFQQ
jgi:hypothetical protein